MVSQLISRTVSRCRCYWRRRACFRITTVAVLVAVFASPLSAAGDTIVRMETSVGGFNVQLYDTAAPLTVTNFLNYVNRNDYNNSIIDRSVPGFVIQGGGYNCCDPFVGQPFAITADPPVQSEFDPSRSNVRGTIAMALLSGDPNSATSAWFFNLADNSANLDHQNGGFTVFGYVLDSGMDVVDAIAGLTINSLNPTFPNLPVFNNYYVWVFRVCINNDGDGACPGKEDLAVNPDGSGTGDGNGDGIQDRDQENVTTTTSSFGTVVTFATATGAKLEIAGPPIYALQTPFATFSPPSGSSAQFNEGLYTLKMNGTMGTGRTVTIFHGTPSHATHYYAYGPTSDNPTPHWYDFMYDSTTGTGAEITGDKIILHFVDGGRGDDDMTVNGSVTHTGGPATVSALSSSSAGGCSIAATPSRIANHGDWILVSMFLAFVALARKRNRLYRIGTARH